MTLIMTESFDGSSLLLAEYLDAKHGKFIPGLTGRQGGCGTNAADSVGAVLTPSRHQYSMYFQSWSPSLRQATLMSIFDPSEEDDTVVLGVALYGQFAGPGSDGIYFSEQRNVGGVATRIDHASVTCNTSQSSNGQMVVRNAAGTTVATLNSILTSAWKYFEMKVKVHDTLGTIDIRIDGVSVLSLTNQDTRNNAAGSTGLINCIFFSQQSYQTQTTFYIDDMYILNEQGSAPLNDFLGDVTVNYQQVSGVGSDSQWLPSAGVPNWNLVNDLWVVAPVATDFVSATTDNQKDMYTVEDMPQVSPSLPLAVLNFAYVDKADTGIRTAALVTKVGSNEIQSSDLPLRDSSNGGPQYLKQILTSKPGGGDWSVADVNVMEIGVVCRP